ncbi:hypothetical protein A3J78_01910 [Candidatus Beckwithbacteria bacterium RBG_13_35_6]|uniref:TrpR-like protein YerC/YecD n=1 Tax=Candidatus Beckwithbacteria bacterium RBG_13_35_6 TaxID=1797456 RepID=A0A1F5DG96_9BACT|nr:MAG: hypothetical protein A3J78_01910 [Candidatus Beckwithbacteria bacterium RBG_13_35_6]
MQISKLKLQKDIANKMFNTFFQTIADLNNPKDVKQFFGDFLTPVEQTTLAKRLMIAYLLEEEQSYKYIKSNLKVSSATIASVDKMMSNGSQGFTLALKKIDADQWADKTAKKVSKLINNIVGK